MADGHGVPNPIAIRDEFEMSFGDVLFACGVLESGIGFDVIGVASRSGDRLNDWIGLVKLREVPRRAIDCGIENGV